MKLDRLIGILTILLRGGRVTTPYLAERFEVSRRTIGRDIDALCQAGIPVVTYQGAGGGVAVAEGFTLERGAFTAEELSDVAAALKGLGSVSDKARFEHMLGKLNAGGAASERDSVVIDLASHYKGSLTAKIGMLRRAISRRLLVEFDYYYEKGEERRTVEPYLVVFQWSAWYLLGFCKKRGDWRKFKLTRLWGLHVTDCAYEPREIPPERRDTNAGLPDNNRVVALFDPSVKHQLIDAYGLRCYTEENGMLRMEIGYTNRAYMVSWLLGFGHKARVMEPEDIASEIRETAKMILELYE